MRKKVLLSALVFMVSGLLLPVFRPADIKAQTSFSFSVAGDHGSTSNSRTIASLDALAREAVNVHLGVGDLSYMSPGTETQWCNFVKSKVGSSFPFEIVAGNHESDGLNGLIDNFAVCLPNQIAGMVGTYAKEYYVDYPTSSPLARLIMVSPDLDFTNGGFYEYKVGNTHYNWLSNAIDSARAAGIRWLIVGMHKNCITMGTKPCEIGTDVMNLLFSKKVDLILQGHDHNYQRSKQLTCAQTNAFNASCVVDDGADNQYAKGAGSVLVIAGTFGQGQYTINTGDSEAGYFAKWMGSNINSTYGFVKFTVTPDQLTSQFVRSTGGTFSDAFTIASGPITPGPTATPTPTPSITPTPTPTPPPTAQPDLVVTNFTWNPASPTNGSSVIFTVTIKNQGAGSSPSGVIQGVGFYIDGSKTANTWTDNYTNSIPPGGSVTLTTNGPPWTATTGTHTVIAWVDDVNRISESVETNNTLNKTVNVGADSPTPTPTPIALPTPTPTPTTCPPLPQDKGTVTLTATVDQGTYKLWTRMQSQGTTANSYYLQVDGNCPVVVGDANEIPSGTWEWVDYRDGLVSNKITYPLTGGTHTIKLIGRETGTRVDGIFITTDLYCIPIGLGDNCTGTPTPTPTPPPLPGDINNDGVVNILDFQILSNAFGTADPQADLNADGTVNILDFQILSNNFGKSRP